MEDMYFFLMFDLLTIVSIYFDFQLPPLAPSIFLYFSNQGAVFFFFLLLSLPSSVLQCHHEGSNFFSEYDQPNWLFYIGYRHDAIEVESTEVKGVGRRRTHLLDDLRNRRIGS